MANPASDESPEHAPIYRLLLTTAHRLAIEMTAALAFEPVSAMSLVVVELLAHARNPQSPRDLAAALGCSRAAVSQLLDRLVRDRLVERRNNPHDGRGRLLVLTDAGREYGGWAAEALEQCMASFTQQFSPEEKETLHTMLEKLEQGADWHRGLRLLRAMECSPKGRPSLHVR